MIDKFTHALGVVFFTGVFIWILYLVSRIRKLDRLEKEYLFREKEKEYDKKVKDFLSNDLNTRVKLSNKRLGLSGDDEPTGDE